MTRITRVSGLEILDSRGRPTVEATCELEGGFKGRASVPSGASTGKAEAVELRDGDPNRYGGLGCRKAVGNINDDINELLANSSFTEQRELDNALLEFDGTTDKSRLGANAVLAVSLAFAKARAKEMGLPLYAYFSGLLGEEPQNLPRPMINLFSGGKHAGAQVPVQDVLVVPASAGTIDEALSMTYSVYQKAADIIRRKYGMRALTADEGGLAPDFPSVDAMFEDAIESISSAGLEPGRDVALAVDVASSQFYVDGRYRFGDEELDSLSMIDKITAWVERYPIVSVEDGLAEDDWDHWPVLRSRLSGRALVLGDDFLCTNPDRIQRAIDSDAANALLLKVNQIGTITEALSACKLARSSDWNVTISARSGETEDDWLADLAVGWAGNQIKVGSITQSERLAKYNRLLAIEATTNLRTGSWPNY